MKYYNIKKLIKSIVSFCLVVLILMSVVNLILDSDYFEITKITVNGGQKYVSNKEIEVMITNYLRDKKIFQIDSTKVEESLESSFLAIKNSHVNTKFPDEINITVVEREPVAIVENIKNEEKNYYFTDEDGFILGMVAPENIEENKNSYSEIFYTDEVQIGTFLPKDIVRISTQLIQHSDLSGVVLENINFDQKNYFLKTSENVLIISPMDKSPKTVIDIYKSIMEKYTNINEKPTRIDLRYDKVIVSYE